MQRAAVPDDTEATPRRLLDAAAACFAARGYRGTSVRDITSLAGCNVSAVTYHFGGKQALYAAVYAERFDELTRRRVEVLEALPRGPELTLERLIRAFSEVFLEPLREGEHGRQTMQLFLRDMVDGHLPPGMFAERLMRPTFAALMEALRAACPALPPDEARLCCHSLVSQLVHVLQLQRMHRDGGADLPAVSIDDSIEHVVAFTAAGVRACARMDVT